MIENAVTLFPQPDSPTTPSVLPRWIDRSTPSTARTTPSSVSNQVFRPRSSRRGASLSLVISLPPQPRVRGIAEPFADEVVSGDRQEDQQAREDRDPPHL